MKNKTMLLALVVVSGLLALPSMASAAGWDIDPAGVSFTSAGGTAKLVTVSGTTVTCTSNSGTGKYDTNSQTTGKIELTFKGCTSSFFNCTSAGQATGVITTTPELVFHNIMIESTGQLAGGTPGILITPNAGHFATFSCGGEFLKVVVTGNGIVGDISAPKCGGSSTTATLNFEQTSGVQKYQQEETAGTKYHLNSSLNGGAAGEAGQEGTGTVTYSQSATITCP
jgi:hypothetical protein